jgi:hypothetical protein
MPRTADKKVFEAHRALARALARLAPIYRQRIVAAVGRALADDTSNGALELIGILNGAELRRAHQIAAAARDRCEAAPIERRLARLVVFVTAIARRIAGMARHRNRLS